MGAGAGLPEIPFPVTSVVTTGTASGVDYPNGLPWNLGDRFVDNRGRIFALWKIDPALTNNATASGEVMVLKANHTVTNDVSDGLDATSPIFAGVALGALDESSTTTTVRHGLFLVKGRCTVTITDGNVAASDILIVNTSVDGGCIEIDETATNLAANKTSSSFVGVALADDDGNNDCDVYVSSFLFG